MKRLLSFAAIVAAFVATLALIGCSGGPPSNAQVSITKTGFQPASVEVKAGGAVTWTNHDATSHTVTADDMSYDSQAIFPGKTYTQRYDRPGTYAYYCRYVTTLKGTVTIK